MLKKWIPRILKGIVAFICAALIWRILFAGWEVLDEFIPTKATAELYNAKGDIKIITNDIADEISDNGYFSVFGFYYSPDTKEVQVTVRYNDSTLNKLQTNDIDFFMYTVDTSGEPVVPETDPITGEPVESVRLHQGYPIGDIIAPSAEYTLTDESLFYNYEKLVFEGIEIDSNTNVIVSLCLAGNSDEEKAVLAVHFAEQPMEDYELSDDDREALATYGK